MDLKKTYSYFVLDYLKSIAIVYLIVTGVTVALFVLAMFWGEAFSIDVLADFVPNYFTVFIVCFIFSLVSNRSGDLIFNQFGKSRQTSFVVNLLVMITISIITAFVFSLLLSLFYKLKLTDYVKFQAETDGFAIINGHTSIQPSYKFDSRITFWLYSFVYYIYVSIFASSVGIFIYSLWIRLEKLYRWIVFLLIPVGLTYLIPKFIIDYIGGNPNSKMFLINFIKFFGLENGFSYKFVFVSTLVVILPLLVISYFIMLRKPLYGKKK
ncbi:MAG: hypothetical protein ACPKNR_11355 [Pleomorphochaeta sp.]